MASASGKIMIRPLTFLEFFAGGGMARAGLGAGWRCAFANDFDPKKAATYAANWGDAHLICADVARLAPADLPAADLAWASFPCQDLSLAGGYAGLGGEDGAAATRSGAFWPFWRLMRGLRAEGRGPRAIVLENVPGALRANRGRDFAALCGALAAGGYRYGAVVVDAVHFVPQSRPRLFFVGFAGGVALPAGLRAAGPDPAWHPRALVEAQTTLPPEAARGWVWWRLPAPPVRQAQLAEVIETEPTGVRWHSPDETARLIGLMSEVNLAKVGKARNLGRPAVGFVYRRTRPDASGRGRQRAEVRFDDVAGCLRTPSGGSSRQTLLLVEGARLRSRLLSPREAARLMGLPDGYVLPDRYNDAYHVAGDGVCVPAVRFLAETVLEPALRGRRSRIDDVAAE